MDKSTLIGTIVLAGLAIIGYGRMFTSGRNTKRLKKLLPQATVVDIRTTAEYKNGHFPGAINIPFDKLTKSRKRLAGKNTFYILYCNAEGRARRGVRALRMMGFTKVVLGGTLRQMEKLTEK